MEAAAEELKGEVIEQLPEATQVVSENGPGEEPNYFDEECLAYESTIKEEFLTL
jgi:hypothetical protein